MFVVILQMQLLQEQQIYVVQGVISQTWELDRGSISVGVGAILFPHESGFV